MPATLPRLRTTNPSGLVENRPRLPAAQGYSQESQIALKQTRALRRNLRQPLSLNRASPSLSAKFQEIYEEHGENGWDGNKAPAVTLAMLGKAKAILDQLPTLIPDPELLVEPDDGSLVLEWWSGYRRLVLVAISPSLKLSYMSLLGGEQSHGTLGHCYDDNLRPDVIALICLVTQ